MLQYYNISLILANLIVVTSSRQNDAVTGEFIPDIGFYRKLAFDSLAGIMHV